ncbi:hypothetical protein E9536_40365 [Burkholderia sp. LS-044]|uniref:hypothetical protein n=1 Tax=Burkholderia sp. LS-044 TaxID=1459967 RepID=UPI0010A68079|nr:hypothetical protein [Burkholderia sp. LS-044]THJ46003.1 hypothetical protein E9536_40365 [Burkholderia sp. LS-044]
MLHLVYILRPTSHARLNINAFWSWVSDRESWFYAGLEMAHDPRWYVRTIGADVHSLEHIISFSDEAAWGAYRTEISVRSQDAAWERRRVEQELWWEILDARILTDAPIRRTDSISNRGHNE